jgi:hypothetical protein
LRSLLFGRCLHFPDQNPAQRNNEGDRTEEQDGGHD